MSQSIRWELSAFHPTSLGSVTLSTLPKVYQAKVEQALTNGTGQQYAVEVNWSNGDLNDGEDWSWRESDEAMRYMSQVCSELIWMVHAKGEEHKEWAVYAYKGVQYQVNRPEWDLPLPNVARLPTLTADPLPRDPLPVEAALRMAADQMRHAPNCPAVEIPPMTLSSRCTCSYGEVLRTLNAL